MVGHYTEAEIERLQRDFKRRLQLVGKALKGMPLHDAYILLSSFLYVAFDHLPDRTVEMMLIYIVTNACESRAARREGRPMDLNTRHQLESWADMQRDPAGVHVSVTPRITMTSEEWEGTCWPNRSPNCLTRRIDDKRHQHRPCGRGDGRN